MKWPQFVDTQFVGLQGSGFGASRPSHHGLESPIFQGLIKDAFSANEALASSFLNKLFNMLNWTVTEFSVAMKEMQDLLARRQVRNKGHAVLRYPAFHHGLFDCTVEQGVGRAQLLELCISLLGAARVYTMRTYRVSVLRFALFILELSFLH